MTGSRYIKRLASSPSGGLHFGPLIAALGSYPQAHANQSIWRVRIEDIDPPREVPGAADIILHQLDHYGLHRDGDVLWQSQRYEAYRKALAWLGERGLSYYCTCIRMRIHAVGGIYDDHCRDLGLGAENAALRLRRTCPVLQSTDRLRGMLVANEPLAREDFIIHRHNGLFAYNLAVMIDDHFQGIAEVVRGADPIELAVRQISLYQHFGWQAPDYLHLPLALSADGSKFSKQNHASVLPEGDPRSEIVRALRSPNQNIVQDWQVLSMDDLLSQVVANW